MSSIIDIHNGLVPGLLVFSDFWGRFGISASNHASVLRFATGDAFGPDGIDVQSVVDLEGQLLGAFPRDNVVFRHFQPQRLVREFSLLRGPGLLILESGGFHPPDIAPPRVLPEAFPATFEAAQAFAQAARATAGQAIELSQPLRLYPGQRLRGAGAESGGTYLAWRGGQAQWALEILNADEADAGGVWSGLEQVRLENGARAGQGVVCRAAGARIVGVTIRGFPIALSLTSDASAVTIRRTDLDGGGAGLAISAGSKDHIALGCRIVSRGTPLRMEGETCAVVRSRIEQAVEGTLLPGTPVVELGGSSNAIVGCHVVTWGGSGPMVAVRSSAEAALLEKNVYSTPAGTGFVRLPLAPEEPGDPAVPILRDQGRGTVFRDVAPRGMPQVLISTRNYLPNGDFAEEASPPRLVPLHWREQTNTRANNGKFATRDRWFRQGLQPPAGAFVGRGQMPTGPNFGSWQGQFDERQLFEKTSEAHLGSQSLWMGLRGPSKESAVVWQEVELPGVARSFTLSGFIKARGAGRVALQVLDDAGLLNESIYSGANGGWQQRTVLYERRDALGAPIEGGGPFVLRVRCIISRDNGAGTEAFFDRMQLVPGEIVPHWQPYWLDDGMGEWKQQVTTRRGRQTRIELRSIAPDPPQGTVVVGTEMELERDLLVSWRARSPSQAQGLMALDIRRAGQSLFGEPVTGVPVLFLQGDRAVGKIPLARVSKEQRSFAEGDVLSLHALGHDLSVVLTGRCRRI